MNFFCLLTVLVYPFHLSSFLLRFIFLFNVFHGQHAPNSVAHMHNFYYATLEGLDEKECLEVKNSSIMIAR